MLKDLGYTENYIETKRSISEKRIGKGKRQRSYKPDYIIYLDKEHKKPVLIIDAKAPNKDAEEGLSDSQLYVSIIRRKIDSPKPDQYCIGTNGLRLIVKYYDSDKTEHQLLFTDFQDNNPKYRSLKEHLSHKSLTIRPKFKVEPFEFKKPEIRDIIGIFEACHKLIWKTEKRSPSSAFYEFAKIMFVKLNEDKKLRLKEELRKKIEAQQSLPKDEVIFSIHWVGREERTDPNPVDSILFKNLRGYLEAEIAYRRKKRIFDEDEHIDLDPSTIKEVVKLLEHFDLFGIDEDLNGRLFETFLSATMRGKELGQFFTPRSVVQFMTELADLKANKDHIDKVLDACCGTGGFLIEAMADISNKIYSNPSLSSREKEELVDVIRNECLYGIDAGKSPPIARIARINMFLHGDGGSRIYFADSLDKEMLIELGIDEELRREREELQNKLITEGLKFDVVLTNPPFAMTYEEKNPKEKRILEQYVLAYKKKGETKELRSSLRSNVMFIERYYEFLKPHGKLLTLIDESILNTRSKKRIRDFIQEKFLVKAVISLPRNTFVNAESAMKTSILYLVKKEAEDEEQPATFMAISKNIGHNDMGRPTPDENDLPLILDAFRKFERGEIQPQPIPKGNPDDFAQISLLTDESVFTFNIKLTKDLRRLDCEYNHPRHLWLKREMDRMKNPSLELRKLGDLVDPKRGKSSRVYVTEGFSIIKIINLTGHGLDWNTDFVSSNFFYDNEEYHLKKYDVLVCCTGIGSLGKVDILETETQCMTVPENTFLRMEDSLLAYYLLYFLRSKFGQTQIERLASGGTGQTHLYPDDLREIKILKPKSREKIQEIVETIQGQEKEANVKLEEALRIVEQYDRVLLNELGVTFTEEPVISYFSVLMDKFENKTNRMDAHFFDPKYYEAMEILNKLPKKEGIKVSSLGKLLSDSETNLTGGATPRGAVYPLEGIPFIRVQNVGKGRIDVEGAKRIERRIHDGLLKRSKLKPMDVLLTITGTYGVSAVVPQNLGEANINQHNVKIEVNQDEIDPYYLSCFLNSEICKRQMDRAVTGGTRPALDYPAIRALTIVYPEGLAEQRRIALHVDDLLKMMTQKQDEYNNFIEKTYSTFTEMLNRIAD